MPIQYLVSGVSVLLDIPISTLDSHGWQEVGRSSETADVTIRTFDISDCPDLTQPRGKSDFFFQPKAGLIFRISEGSRISIYREIETDERDITIFLVGSVWGVLCHQRGLLPLHCSAVAAGSSAFAFIAPSGNGKSTLAASLFQRGYDHICDDVAIIDVSPEKAVSLQAMPKGLKLWQEAVDALRLHPRELVTSDKRINKYYVDLPKRKHSQHLNLKAIYALHFDDTAEPYIEPLKGAELLKNLYVNIYRIEWIDSIGEPRKILAQARELAEAIPVFRFARPRIIENLQSSTEFLDAHLSSITAFGKDDISSDEL